MKNEKNLLKEIPKSFAEKREKILISGNTLIVADIHCPYHNPDALKTMLKFVQTQKIKNIILLGDIIDFYQISKFQKNPRNPNLQLEIDTTIQMLTIIRKLFPKTRIIYTDGNHEARLNKWLWTHAEVLNLKSLEFENLLDLNKLGIEHYDNYTLIEHTGTNLLMQHGDTIASGGINPGRNTLLKNMVGIVFGHLHRSDSYIFNTLKKEKIESYSVGCLCDTNPDYWCYANNWNNGFALILNNVFLNKRIYDNSKII